MSYDLNLFPRNGEPLERDTFLAEFSGDSWTVEDDTANYSNPDTGVYFHFTWYAGGDVEEPNARSDAFRGAPYIHFNMNYFRPSYFAMEAGEVLAVVIEQFDLAVYDPQGRMTEGVFDELAFIDSWSKVNRATAKIMAGRTLIGPGAGGLSWPAATGRMYWAWNRNRPEIGEYLWTDDDIDVYVPRVMYFREDGKPKTFCMFPDMIPSAIPKVDRVLVIRQELGKGYKKRSSETPAWVTWDELREVCEDFEVRDFNYDCSGESPALPYLILFDEDDYPNKDKAPKALAKWVIGLPDWPGKPQQVMPSDILDEELMNG